jgi:uncharacterized protein (DUF952 family)
MQEDKLLIYKICPRDAWDAATVSGAFAGSADDVRDGFIHLSAEHQLVGTAMKYFSRVDGLVVVAFDAKMLESHLKWEASRGGDLFPHYYGPLPASAALWVRALPLDGDGVPLVAKTLRL